MPVRFAPISRGGWHCSGYEVIAGRQRAVLALARRVGNADVRGPRFVFPGALATADGQHGDYGVERALAAGALPIVRSKVIFVSTSGTFTERAQTFAGQPSASPDPELDLLSDADLSLVLPRHSWFIHVVECVVPLGGFRPAQHRVAAGVAWPVGGPGSSATAPDVHYIDNGTGPSLFDAAPATLLATASNAFSNQSSGYGTIGVLWDAPAGVRAGAVLGDSLIQGNGSTPGLATWGNAGVGVRLLHALGHGYVDLAVSSSGRREIEATQELLIASAIEQPAGSGTYVESAGSGGIVRGDVGTVRNLTAGEIAAGAGYRRRLKYLQYCDFAVTNAGNNDVRNLSLADHERQDAALLALLKAGGRRAISTTYCPRTRLGAPLGASDTLPAGERWQAQSARLARVGTATGADGILHYNRVLSRQSARDLYKASLDDDGTHFNEAGHQAVVAEGVRAVLGGLIIL